MKKELAEELTIAAFRTVFPGRDFEGDKARSWDDYAERTKWFANSKSNDFFRKLVEVVFYSGIKAKTVTSRMPAIMKYLGDFRSLASFNDEDILRICSAEDMIKNRAKIRACIHNARVFESIEKEFGSFKNYLLSYNQGFPTHTERIPELLVDLDAKFKFLGPRTSRHFLMICGFPLVKPDRMVMRVLHRLNLIPGEGNEFINEAVGVCLGLAEKVHIPPIFMDTILVGIGQSEGAELCKKDKPECEKCGLRPFCKFSPSIPA
jgi:DNA-3-methyladenine glycosylase I